MKRVFVCPVCGSDFLQEQGQVNRASRRGYAMRCSRVCSGAERRKPPAEKKALKATYDRHRREALSEQIRQQKASYYARTRNRERERLARRQRMPKHVAYCRRPEYVAWKKGYDQQHRAKRVYGPFAEAALALYGLEKEVAERATRQEIYESNGTANKALRRKRELA